MSRRSDKVMWILGGLLVLGLVGTAIGAAKMLGYDPSREQRHALVGRVAPEFTLPLVAGEGAGDRVAVRALEGRVVLLDFWASWCQPCRRSIPLLNQVYARYRERITMLGVNVDAGMSAERIRGAHRSFAADFPSLADERLEVQGAYGVTSIPTLVLIDRSGVVRWVDRGVPDPDEVSERIDDLLAMD